ncbi:hypothetical protein FRB91_009717, partial [Serendipita sp. 411]
ATIWRVHPSAGKVGREVERQLRASFGVALERDQMTPSPLLLLASYLFTSRYYISMVSLNRTPGSTPDCSQSSVSVVEGTLG